jgi:hypothetical protein
VRSGRARGTGQSTNQRGGGSGFARDSPSGASRSWPCIANRSDCQDGGYRPIWLLPPHRLAEFTRRFGASYSSSSWLYSTQSCDKLLLTPIRIGVLHLVARRATTERLDAHCAISSKALQFRCSRAVKRGEGRTLLWRAVVTHVCTGGRLSSWPSRWPRLVAQPRRRGRQ